MLVRHSLSSSSRTPKYHNQVHYVYMNENVYQNESDFMFLIFCGMCVTLCHPQEGSSFLSGSAKLIEVSASSLMSKRILPSVNNGEEKTLFYGDYLHL